MLKAISIRQPEAWAVASGVKTIENRTWETNVRGLVAIHASSAALPLDEGCVGFELEDGTQVMASEMVTGAIIGVAEIVDCLPTAKVKKNPFKEGPWCFILRNACLLPTPIPCRGALKFWDVPLDVLAKIEAQIAHAATA